MTMDNQTQEKLKAIKRSFFLRMDGTASRSMREKGLDYKINWGVSIPDLRQMAAQYGKDYALAIGFVEREYPGMQDSRYDDHAARRDAP